MRRARSVAGKAVLFAVIGSVGILFGGVSTSVDREPDAKTFSRAYRGTVVARSSCHGDVCAVLVPGPFELRLLPGMGRVDLDVSLTVEYRTTKGDPATIVMRLKPPGEPRTTLPPGEYELRPGRTTTATLHWIKNNVPVVDGAYEFTWNLLTGDGASVPYDLKVTEAVLVIQATVG